MGELFKKESTGYPLRGNRMIEDSSQTQQFQIGDYKVRMVGDTTGVYFKGESSSGQQVFVKPDYSQVFGSASDNGEQFCKARLRREHNLQKMLEGVPNVCVPIELVEGLKVGEPLSSLGSRDYLVLPYIDGKSLQQLQREKRVTAQIAIDVLFDVSKALSYAHKRGIVHRDLKPGNVILGGYDRNLGTYKSAHLIDFGEGAHLGEDHPSLDGVVRGTFGYMSPEQERGEPASIPDDLWGFGALAYSLLEGQPPFHLIYAKWGSASVPIGTDFSRKTFRSEEIQEKYPHLGVQIVKSFSREHGKRPGMSKFSIATALLKRVLEKRLPIIANILY